MPAGLTRLFKSPLDWNLYSSLQEAANNRQAGSHDPVQNAWPAIPIGGVCREKHGWVSTCLWVLLSLLA